MPSNKFCYKGEQAGALKNDPVCGREVEPQPHTQEIQTRTHRPPYTARPSINISLLVSMNVFPGPALCPAQILDSACLDIRVLLNIFLPFHLFSAHLLAFSLHSSTPQNYTIRCIDVGVATLLPRPPPHPPSMPCRRTLRPTSGPT